MIARLETTTLYRVRLWIGKGLRDAGIDLSVRYDFMYDSNERLIGMMPADNGYFVRGLPRSPYITITAFAKHFNLTNNENILRFSRDGNIWILHL